MLRHHHPLRSLKMFANLPSESMKQLEPLFQFVALSPGGSIFRQEEKASHLVILFSGRVVLTTTEEIENETFVVELNRTNISGSIFGDECLLQDVSATYTHTATAMDKAAVLKLPRKHLDKFIHLTHDLGTEIQRVAFEKRTSHNILSSMDLFSSLSAKKLYLACFLAKFVTYPEGSYVMQEGHDSTNDGFFVLTRGCLEVFHRGIKLSKLNIGAYVGEVSLVTNKPHAVTLKASKDCTCMMISKTDFKALFSDESSILAEFAIKVFGSAIDFATLIRHPKGRSSFADFCANEHSDENMRFLDEVETLESFARNKVKKDVLETLGHDVAETRLRKQDVVDRLGSKICETFVVSDSPREISMSGETQRALVKAYTDRRFAPKMFSQAKDLLMSIMENDSFVRYKNSDMFRDFLDELGVYAF